MASMVIRSLAILGCLAVLNLSSLGQAFGGRANVRFEVLSVRKMNADEAARRLSDTIGLDLSVRFRLTNLGTQSIYFYAWKGDIFPWGNAVKKTQDGIIWKVGEKESKISPGIDPTVTGNWLILGEGSAVEWEMYDSTKRSGELHANTLFMKVGTDGVITEVISDIYEVPPKDK